MNLDNLYTKPYILYNLDYNALSFNNYIHKIMYYYALLIQTREVDTLLLIY